MPPTGDELALEQALHGALHDLAEGQPAQPTDRMSGVRRRHVRRRAWQGATAVAAAAAVVAGILIGTSQFGTTAQRGEPLVPPDQERLSWQLPWPSRVDSDNGTTPAMAYRDRAAAIAHFELRHFVTLRNVWPLYTGTPDGTDVHWVVVEATWGRPAERHLLGLASPDGGTSWESYIGDAPAVSTSEVGFAWSDENAGNSVFVLGSPEAPDTGLVDLSSGDGSLLYVGEPLVLGVAVLHLDHRPALDALYVGQPDLRTNYPVLFAEGDQGGPGGGIPAWQRALPGPLPTSARLATLAGTAGGNSIDLRADRDGLAGALVRCAGPAPLTITLTTSTDTVREVAKTCDGELQGVRPGIHLRAGQHLRVTVDGDAALSFTLGIYQERVPQ